ncbi:PREDICTED: DNA polymerase theta [Habropoda laboriosa]|uniref:DNA polymerase theta n=1 Tax=Habropoda laboriosa TaxID=597456 RepID=UPI00083E2C03|nr:PREDICTED: DNA polymerase theta [Habropoda laboriosa]
MQSFNKLPSFGDDTLSACIQAEVKNMDINNGSNMDVYFQDSTFPSKLTTKSNDIDKVSRSKQISHTSTNIKPNLNRNNSKHKESRINNISKSKLATKTSISNKLTIKKITSIRKNCDLLKINKENINTSANHIKTDTSNKNTLSKQCSKSELSSLLANNSSVKSNITTNNTTNVKLCNSSIAISNTEKSSESCSSISIIPTQDRYKLGSWGLPPNILQKYVARGITNMFAWQVECLSKHKVIEEVRNLVYSAPTSAGKTLVAEILMIKTVLERRKKVIFILPFVSVVREKMYYFQDLLSDSGVRVEGFTGGVVPPGGFAATHVAIATIEKANSLINRLMEENELVNLGAVVIDELHLVGDPNRGYLLELLLTKLKYMTFRNENINIQLIGMSATLPNISLLAKWLDAELYKTEFRPIPLNEQCKIGKNIYDSKLRLIRSLIPMPELSMDSDDIFHLCIETISDGHSVLIFCPTKNWCEKLAEQIAAAFYKLGQENTQLGKTLRDQLDSALISETLEQLKRSPIGLDNVLKNTVSFGVAFHHAGLTMDERDIIEGSFRSGSLRVLIATSTLSSGVNLPARRVIVRSPMFGGRLLDSLTYRQMIGRAGRMGKDTAGESILMCKPNEQKAAETLLSASLKPIHSCLEDSGPLIRALLEAIASEVVYTPSDLELYTKCTLVSLSEEHDSNDPANEAIKFLIDNEFLLLQKTEEGHRWVATAFGKACLAASIPPRDGLFLLEELQKARRCFVLDTELHVVYLVTPLNSGNQIGAIDWMTFLELWKLLSESERRVGQLVGVEERFLTSAIKGIVRSGKSLNIHRRFYTALALHDLVREVPLNAVCKKYGCCRGVLQTLQQSASTFAGMVTQFCKQLGWDCMELLVSQFQTRLQFGVCRELLDLLRLPMLNGLRARSLYKQGITSVADLAMANELDVERALYKALPFESEKEYDGEHESEAVKRNKMRTVFVTGKDGLTTHEAAIMLVHEARALVQNELRLQDMSWKQNEQSSVTNTSNSEISLQVQRSIHHSTKRTAVQIKVETTSSNFENKINSNQNEILNEHVKSSDLTSQSMKKNMNFIDENQGNCKSYENEKYKVNTNVIKNFIDSKCDLENNMIEEGKNDDIKLTDQLLQIDTLELLDSPIEKLSFDFFEDSNPKIIHKSQEMRNSESLINCKSNKKNRTQNFTIQPSLNDVQNAPSVSNTSVKKIRISNETDTVIPTCVNTITRISSFENDIQPTVSRSPSLFNDSLKLDTQICNALEQNIFDSLHFSEFEDSKLSEDRVATENKINRKLQATHSICNETQTKKDITDKNIDSTSLNFSTLHAKHNSLSWKDDSWNEPKKITEKLNQIQDKNNEDVLVKCNIRNIKNTNVHLTETAEASNSTPKMRNKYDTNLEKPISTPDNLKKITRKRVFKDISVVKSPMANVILFSKTRATSLDSNKSDSDDIVIASQNVDSPATSIKIRNKLSYERKQRICTQKIPKQMSDDAKYTNIISKPIRDEEYKIKATLKKIFLQNVLTNKDCSTDSVISNSDEGTPIKTANILQKSKISLKRTQTSSRMCLQTNEFVGNMDEEVNWNTINIIKVGSDRPTFNLFKREVMQKRYIALALNCELYNNETNNIGTKIIGSINTERKKRTKRIENYVHADKKLCGVAISWENNIAYYISFSNEQDLKIPAKEQMKLLKDLLSNTLLYVQCFATKEIFKSLYECCGIIANCKFLDPKTASWLYDGNTYEKTFNEMVKEHFPQGCFITKRIGACYDIGPGLNIKSTVPGEFRASTETVLTWHITDSLLNKLEQLSPTLLYTFKEIEMKTVTLLACMELTGLGVSLKSLQDLSSAIRAEMTSLEERAYALSAKRFKFSSSKEVAEILGLYKKKKISINKAILGNSDHPISNLVMSWRKLNATQSKIVYPILNMAQHSSRIRGNCVTCTLTGRISMHEPNLQNVPRDFSSEDNSFTISVRMAFIPAIGNVILSADYCQLELRILAHFSKDATLCDIMRKPGDIFKSIAASWNHVSEDQVDDKMRQYTKQLCYGMIYGMGLKTLAESLSVDEVKAKEFLESFMNAYPSISKWLNNVLQDARTNGYVTTILDRRRMFPGLTSTIPAEKSQAERQAVNTTIQGSAADIAKKAMVNIEERIRFEFPTSAAIMSTVNSTRKLRSNSREAQQRGGYLILQLHDELLYEVNIKDLRQIATIVKESMEQVCQLAVPLTVKLKVGPAWGDLSEYNL